MVTLKNIVEDLEAFATAHEQINDFGWGNISNISTKNHSFEMLWLMPMQSSYIGDQTILRFDMYMIDLLEHDRSNLLDVMNNTMINGNDVVAYFFKDNQGLDFELDEDNVSLTPFEGKFDDNTAGWKFSIELHLTTNLNPCIIPVTE